jgi:hypothetical protein
VRFIYDNSLNSIIDGKVINSKHALSWYERTKSALVECIEDAVVAVKAKVTNDSTIKIKHEEHKKAKKGFWRAVVGWGSVKLQNLGQHAFSETEFAHFG